MANLASYLRKRTGITSKAGATTTGSTNIPGQSRVAVAGPIKKKTAPAKSKKVSHVRPGNSKSQTSSKIKSARLNMGQVKKAARLGKAAKEC